MIIDPWMRESHRTGILPAWWHDLFETYEHICRNEAPDLARTYAGMRGRCLDSNHPSYKHYGGRGIKICRRWSLFPVFCYDMGPKPSPKHSIDRINNDGHYTPGNCRWATATQQANNRRPRTEWSKKTGDALFRLTSVPNFGTNGTP